MKFPTTFAGASQRKVELSGEAYFEVSKDKNHPFIVKSSTQEVKVLGTHFNINSYTDEPNVKTTLLEGSVLVNNVTLKPGDQSTNAKGAITVAKVDTETAVAWKDGDFVFRNEPLESIMRKVTRWYNVQVTYQGQQVGKQVFGGTISKFDKVSKVLHMLELTGDVHFKIEGRRITVMK